MSVIPFETSFSRQQLLLRVAKFKPFFKQILTVVRRAGGYYHWLEERFVRVVGGGHRLHLEAFARRSG